jgi:glutaminyl-peptide cyclotransferase
MVRTRHWVGGWSGAVAGIGLAVLALSGGTGLQRAPAQAPAAARATPVYGYRVVHVYPHDPQAFTQGLIFRDGVLYESTGLNGQSSLRKVKLETGEVLQQRDVDRQYFAEGLTDWGDRLVQLTWQTGIGFLYDRATFKPIGTFPYKGEGWGLTHDRTRLIMSDGSANLRFLDPATLGETGRVEVRDGNGPVKNLNELEVVRDEVYANIWQTERIARIAIATGRVTGWIDLAGLKATLPRTGPADVMNGIAYDAAGDRLCVTGKWWPRLFEIALVPQP